MNQINDSKVSGFMARLLGSLVTSKAFKNRQAECGAVLAHAIRNYRQVHTQVHCSVYINGSQLGKMKKNIPDMFLP